MYFEICGVCVSIGSEKVIIASIYRPSNPKSDQKLDKFFEDIEKSLEKIHNQFGPEIKILIAGDMNIDILKEESKANRLIIIFKTFGLKQINFSPTRFAGNSKTLIDHIFANFVIDSHSVKTESVIFSDHEAITLSLPFGIQKMNTILYQSQTQTIRSARVLMNAA
jgi:hypothetical protein